MTSSSEKTTKKAHGHHSTDSVARTKHTGSVVLLFAFPECVAKGSRFTLGVWGQSLLRDLWSQRSQPSASVRNRAQPLATVGNRRATLSLPKGCVIHSPAHTKHEVAAQLQAAPNLTLASRLAHSTQTAWIQGVFALVFFARVEPPFMQKIHRSACATFSGWSLQRAIQKNNKIKVFFARVRTPCVRCAQVIM